MRKTIGTAAAAAVMTVSAVTLLAYPGSAAPAGVATYQLTLTGAHEVPENPHGGRDRGDGTLTIDASTGQVCYTSAPCG